MATDPICESLNLQGTETDNPSLPLLLLNKAAESREGQDSSLSHTGSEGRDASVHKGGKAVPWYDLEG